MIDVLKDIELLLPWEECSKGLEDELSREISTNHILYGVEAISIARRVDNDDVLFFLSNNEKTFAVVHLTWSQREESNPYPLTRLFSSLEEWIENCMRADHEDYVG